LLKPAEVCKLNRCTPNEIRFPTHQSNPRTTRNRSELTSQIAKAVNNVRRSGPPRFIQRTVLEVPSSAGSTSPLAYSWPTPLVGTKSNSRLGNTIDTTHISFHFLLANNSTSSTGIVVVRHILLEVKGGNSLSNADINSMLLEPTSSALTTDTALTGTLDDTTNAINREPFRVITQGLSLLGPQSSSNCAIPNVQQVKYSAPYKRQWRFADSADQDPTQNRLVLLFFSRDAVNDSSVITVEYTGSISLEYHTA
jgi:hypothetical protein